MSEPMFSIIVPVYNTEKELERCVNSVTCQTYRDFELILVDDGSKDNSGALCDVLAEADTRIVVVHQQNSGSSEARNTGIRIAKGQYLIFVDSDDMWDDPDALHGIADVIEKNPGVDVVCFGVKIFDDDGTFVKARIPASLKESEKSKEAVLRQLVYSNQYFSASYVKVLRRGFFIDNDLFFVKGLISGEDGEWSARVMVCCNSIDVFSNGFYKRIRRKEGGITSSIKKKNILDVFQAIDNGIQFIDKNAETDALKEIYREYWAYQYAMLFSLAYRLHKDPGYASIITLFRKYKWLLKYDHVRKVKAVRILSACAGIRGALYTLAVFNRLR